MSEIEKKSLWIYTSKSWEAEGKKYIEGIASDETMDRAGDVILATAWQLDNYMKNPVLLWSHNYREPPVGKVIDIWIEEGKLKFRAEFADTEFASEIAKLYTEGYLNTFSVGFLPKEFTINRETGGYVYKRVELLEISAVPVPANPNAVAVLRAKGLELLSIGDIEEGGDDVEYKETSEVITEQDESMEDKDVEHYEEKAGAVLSRRNAEKLKALAGKVKDAITVLNETVDELTDFVDSATGRVDDDEEEVEEKGEKQEKMYTSDEVNKILDAYREALLKQLGGDKE